ncbi:LicD family protein [Actinomyces weissii]|uniref:LicD family protein n=1 Tax=Actinomyces weissii TaxID=675090 RepID=A0A7T7S237_9ACTO|nr:LicD family protein [Actinomyces weissii]QQM67933.1 LicD family protein [Actinomyces weissii]
MTKGLPLTSIEIKNAELEILEVFDKTFADSGLRYSLAGGTLLGAIRHKGFIPWDDDIDVNVPRPDFDRFVSTFIQGGLPEGYAIECYPAGTTDPIFVKLVRLDFAVKERYSSECRHLWIDVFPVDGLPTSMHDLAVLYKRVRRLRLLTLLATADPREGRSTFRKLAKRFLVPFLNELRIGDWAARRLVSQCRKVPLTAADRIGGIAWGLYGTGEALPGDAFDRLVQVEFEGAQYWAIEDWETYLKGLYGDFWKLPPESARVGHDMEVYRSE